MIWMEGCKKSNPPVAPNPPPVITPAPFAISNLSPDSGAFSTVVTVTGSGFDANVSGNSVKFNGVSASVQLASATQLTVIVPVGAGTGPVTITVGSKLVTGPSFRYIYTTVVSTLAGSGTAGFADGNGTIAQFNNPQGVAADALGNVYVADFFNNRIRKISPAGIVSTLAGSGISGQADGDGTIAQFNLPAGVALDAQGSVYVADDSNCRIRKITPSGVVSTLAGSGTLGFADGSGAGAEFYFPTGVITDTLGNVYVADGINDRIRKITPAGMVSTLAGFSVNGVGGYADGTGIAALFVAPKSVSIDAQRNIYVGDYGNNRIRKVTPSGVVTTVAGSGASGHVDGIGTAAQFDLPYGVALDATGNIYVTDQRNSLIRKITPSGVVSTIAGNGTAGFADGGGATSEFNHPFGIAVDLKGNIYVADYLNNRIRKISFQ